MTSFLGWDLGQYAWAIIFFLGGLSWGSFLNVVMDRLPKGLSLISPPSHCDACGKRLAIWQNIPLLSFIFLKGKCHYCGARISVRMPLVEMTTGILFGFFESQYDISLQLVIYVFYLSLLTLFFVIDLEQKIIPNILLYIAFPIAFLISSSRPDIGFFKSLIGGGLAFLILLIPYLVSKGGMGGGDVKLAGLIGVVLGYPVVLVSLSLAIISGGLLAFLLLIFKIRGRKSEIPFGPFLSASTFLSLLWGKQLMELYLELFR